jgi:hypothetical protein
MNGDSITDALPPAVRPATLLSTTAEANATPSLPPQWRHFIDDQEHGHKQALLTDWNDFAAGLPIPIADVPERLRPIWSRIPAKFRDFYTQLHDGWTFLPANSMGPLPLEDWAFLSDDKFDIDDDTARRLPIDISRTVAVFHNGAGDYLCLNCAGNFEATGVIWWHEDPENPEPVDFWGVLDAWVGIFLEEADRHGA